MNRIRLLYVCLFSGHTKATRINNTRHSALKDMSFVVHYITPLRSVEARERDHDERHLVDLQGGRPGGTEGLRDHQTTGADLPEHSTTGPPSLPPPLFSNLEVYLPPV